MSIGNPDRRPRRASNQEDFLRAFGDRGTDEQGRDLAVPSPVVLIDAIQLLADLTHFLQAESLLGLRNRTR